MHEPAERSLVGQARTAEARMDLGGDGAAADDRLPLEDERTSSRFGQVVRCDQAVMAPADDDRVVHRYLPSERIRMAAFRPGAPMMPPPGCVAEPHM